ncbi:MAG: glycosyltransferase [Patescibacteria group bacterium]
MRIALVHDWITGIAGDVRVLHALQQMYPDADTICLSDGKPSRFVIPFFPIRVESLDLRSYDLVISTGSIFSKGLILRPKTYHINYCHSPTRQVWDLSHEYRHKIFQHLLRIWDRQASTRVDMYIANSEHIKARIKKYYRRDSVVIYPPVQNVNIKVQNDSVKFKNYFLIVSRLYRHKNIDIAIKAFNKLGWPLTIIGDGPERARLEALAGPTVHLLGSLPDELLTTHYSLSTAFILPQEEDFGIAPVEALMHGKPVLALRAGGALEYVQEGINGTFFDDPHEAVLADGARRIREMSFDREKIKQSAEKFSWQNFQSSFSNIINQVVR